MDTIMNYDKDRRNAVRVNDRSLFSYKLVPKEKYDLILADYSNGISPYKQWSSSDVHMFSGAQNALEKLRTHNEDLAEFLHYLDTKINLILNSLKGGISPLEGLTLQDLELSGSGIAFYAKEQLTVGDFLELNLCLLPSFSIIHAFGKVVQNEKLAKGRAVGPFKTAAEFTLLMDDDREKIIQHNFKLQTLMLRQRKRKD